MKVTPLDIRRKEFKRSVRGYADEEVDLFLDEVADEFEQLYQANTDLQERIRRLDEQLATHLQLRDALEKTLVSAQFQADETKANARKEAELVLRDAELKARGIVSDSYSEVQKVQQALVQLKHLEEDFRFKFKSLLQGHLKLLAEAPIDLPAGQPVMVDALSSADETTGVVPELVDSQTPFEIPVAIAEVPEYPPAGVGAARPALPAEGEASPPLAAEAPRVELELPEVAMPLTAEPPAPVPVEAQLLWPDEPVAAGSADGEDLTPRDAGPESSAGMNDESVTLVSEDDPLKGFFFTSPKQEGAAEGFSEAEKGGQGKARDFEW